MNGNHLKREMVLKELKDHKQEFAEIYGVTKIGVFGSVARDEIKGDSDIDVVVEMLKPDLFFMVHIKETLEKDLQRPVDIIHYRERMNQYLKAKIQKEAVYV